MDSFGPISIIVMYTYIDSAKRVVILTYKTLRSQGGVKIRNTEEAV